MGFDPERFVSSAIEKIKAQVPEGKKAIIAVSGGVDSSVAAALASKALKDAIKCVFVDTGLMRKNEPEKIKESLSKIGVKVEVFDAKQKFFSSLKNISAPEKKRKIIGKLFIEVFEKIAKEFGAEYLVQGTIAPDWIESGQGSQGLRDTIKSHHNVGGLPKKMNMFLIEPLRDLYKDEVRIVGKFLGLPEEIYSRQPFPGPGLAIRVIGPVSEEKVEIVRNACAIVEEEIENAVKQGKINHPWQYFAVLMPIKTVGVLGDARVYSNTIAVRIVESIDGMTAKTSPIPFEILERISERITRELKKDVNRVVYDITSKPPATIEWE